MQIFGASSEIHAGDFLHAGYLSAYPHSYGEDGDIIYSLSDERELADYSDIVIDVAGSLEIVEGDRGHAATIVVQPTQSHSLFHYPHDDELRSYFPSLGVVIIFFFVIGICAAVVRMKKVGPSQANVLGLRFCIFMLFVTSGLTALWVGLIQRNGPYAAVRYDPLVGETQRITIESLSEPENVCEYSDPEAATQTIMHAILAPAITGIPRYNFLAMEDIREEVGLPIPPNQMTPGMRYAVAHYDRDGWGSTIQVQLTQTTYEIISPGPDCELETEDDILLSVSHDVTANWEELVSGVFLNPTEEILFVHRIASPLFEMNDPDGAFAATGGRLFDNYYHDNAFTGHEEYVRLLNASVGQEEELRGLYFVGYLLLQKIELEMSPEALDELEHAESATDGTAPEENTLTSEQG